MKSIAEEIEELRRMKVPELVARYREVFGKEPRVKHREHLWKRIGWKIQEARYGGLSKVAKDRLEEMMAEIERPLTEQQRTVRGVLKSLSKQGATPRGGIITR